MHFNHLAAVILVLTLVLLVSCGDDTCTSPEKGPEEPYSRATPGELILAFSYAMEHQDIDIYTECLHPEYRFDYVSCYIPEWWECDFYLSWYYEEDVQNTACMFGASTITKIACDLHIDTGPWPTEDGLGYRLDPSIKFTVESSEPSEPTIYWVFSSWLYIEVTPDPSEEGLWIIREIVEDHKEGLGARTAEEASLLAELKWMFRCDAR